MTTTHGFEAPPDDVRLRDWLILHLEHESHCFHPTLGRHVVPNPIRDHWRTSLLRLGGPLGAVQELVIGHRTVRVLDFERGTVMADLFTGSVLDFPSESRPSAELFSRI